MPGNPPRPRAAGGIGGRRGASSRRRKKSATGAHSAADMEHGLVRRKRAKHKLIEDLDPSFVASQFFAQFLYHAFYPFSIPVVTAVEGWQANYILSFVTTVPQLVMTSMIMPSMMWVGLFLFAFAASENPEGVREEPTFLRDWTVRLTVAYHILRCIVVAIKYSYIPPKVYRTMLGADFAASWEYNSRVMLVAAWMDPSRPVLRREMMAAAARRQVDPRSYQITVEPGMRAYTHGLLKEVLETGDHRVLFVDDSRDEGDAPMKTHAAPGASASVASSGQVSPSAEAGGDDSKPAAPWEDRLLQHGKVHIGDMAVAVQLASVRDPFMRPSGVMPRSMTLAVLILLTPYIVAALRWDLTGDSVTSPISVAIHVCLFMPSIVNLGSQLMFLTIAAFDYARRSASQQVLTRLARPVQEGLINQGVNVLFPFASARAQMLGVGEDQEERTKHMLELNAMQDSLDQGELDVVQEEEEEEESEEEEGGGPGHTAVSMAWEGSPEEGHIPDSATAQEEEEEEGEAEKLLEVVAVATAGADTAAHPPIIDVTRPSNAFAWIRLREVLGDMGQGFQKRMQMYIGAGVVMVLGLDASAFVTVVGTYSWGESGEDDLLVVYAAVHTAVMMGVVGLCILLGALANGQATKQAEALMHSQVELEEVAREMQVVVEHRVLASALHHRRHTDTDSSLPGHSLRPPSGRTEAGSHLFDQAIHGHDADHAGQSADWHTHTSGDGHSVAGSMLGRKDGKSSNRVSRAVSGMSLVQLQSLLAGLRSAVSSLTTVITALQIHQVTNPVRVVGVPASFDLLRLMGVVIFVVLSAMLGL